MCEGMDEDVNCTANILEGNVNRASYGDCCRKCIKRACCVIIGLVWALGIIYFMYILFYIYALVNTS